MKEQIVIRALANGQWEIQVLLKKNKSTLIKRGKVCNV